MATNPNITVIDKDGNELPDYDVLVDGTPVGGGEGIFEDNDGDGTYEQANGDGISVGTLASDTLQHDYVLRTDGSTIDAIPQTAGLTEYTGHSDIGPLLETIIVDELPPQGSRKEAAGSIFAKRGQYPGSLDNAPNGAAPPLPTSCHIYGEGRNHINPNKTTTNFPETEPVTEFQTDSVGFIQPNVDSELAAFPMLSNLKIAGPGETSAGSVGLDGGGNSNRWDWLVVKDCVIMDFETAIDFSNTHDTRVLRSHPINFSSVISGPDKHVWHSCGFYSSVSGSSIELNGSSNQGFTRLVDSVISNEAASGVGQVEVYGDGAEVRGCSFGQNGTAGNAFYVDSACASFRFVNNQIRSNSSYDAVLAIAGSGSGDVIAFNDDKASGSLSLKFFGGNGLSDTYVMGNQFPNGVGTSSTDPARVRYNNTVILGGAPDGTNYGSEDAGIEILDTSVSPPDVYYVNTDGTLLGPK